MWLHLEFQSPSTNFQMFVDNLPKENFCCVNNSVNSENVYKNLFMLPDCKTTTVTIVCFLE